MRLVRILPVLFINIIVAGLLSAQDMPLVYDVENTGADCPEPYLASFSELPTTGSLPNPFEWADGRGTIENFSDWRCRRAEIAEELQFYEIGVKPDKPEDIQASFSNGTLTVDVTVDGETLTLTSNINIPDGDGPFPTLIGMGFNPIPDSLTSNRDIATMTFSHDQVTSYSGPSSSNPYYQLYGDLNPENTGQYSAWVWGVSRLIDGLQMVKDDAKIDTEHLAVSGCSYAGKMAIFAGAFDERVALTFGIESGGGGYTTWRYSEVINRTESVETLGKTDYNWFKDDMRQFSSDVDKLPHDHHELMAMVAPRALFVTGNPGWTWLADESGYVGSRATEKVYEALGIGDRFAYSQIGGHNHCAIPSAQVPEIVSYLDRFMLGIDSVDTNVGTSPYTTELGPWMPWETPELQNGTSFFGQANLSSPEDKAAGVDTSITFQWDAFDGVQQYYFQLANNASFKEPMINDSLTGTSYMVDELVKGKRYYWRVQVKNNDGSLGPWTKPYNFITSIELPEKPELVSTSIIRPSRPNYFSLKWEATPFADTYHVEVASDEDFDDILTTLNTSEPSASVSIIAAKEGSSIYWKVQASNIAGPSPWSDTMSFFIIAPPDDLELESTGTNEITLKWDDNSDIEDGYIIERKSVDDATFSVIDSVGADIETYIDATAEGDSDHYFYRMRSYVGTENSQYSEEVTLMIVGIEDEEIIPEDFSLNQNYPNPFNPSTLISYQIPENSLVSLKVFDMMGRQVAELVNGKKSAGVHDAVFNANGLASGMYIYRLEAGNFIQVRKMMLLK